MTKQKAFGYRTNSQATLDAELQEGEEMEKKYTLNQLRSAWAAGKHNQAEDRETNINRGLVDMWFLTMPSKDELGKQGHILKEVVKDKYIVQYFEWVFGEPIYRKIVKLSEMESWAFFDSFEAMDRVVQRHLEHQRETNRQRKV